MISNRKKYFLGKTRSPISIKVVTRVIFHVIRCDILVQGLIELIEYPYQQGVSSFSEAYLERTFKLSVLVLEQFRMGDRPISFVGCA
jgi:hypothetical protein